MKNLCSQHKTGFTLVEVIIAITLVGMLMTSIFALLNSSMRSTFETNSLVSRILVIKNQFFDPQVQSDIAKNPTKEIVKNVQDPKTQVVIKAVKSKNKFIENNFSNIYQFTSTAKWQDLNSNEESIVGFKYINLPSEKS